MKILLVSSSDMDGGAARAAYRLHQSLLEIGIDSHMLVHSKSSSDPRVLTVSSNLGKFFAKILPYMDILLMKLYPKKEKILFTSNFFISPGILKTINSFNADIVHLNWFSSGMIRIEDLSRIKAPIVWTLHDSWAYTGGCHVHLNCSEYIKKCGRCINLKSTISFDLSRINFLRKKIVYNKLKRLKIVGVSNWLLDTAKKSNLFSEKDISCLPNPINTKVYAPFDKLTSRKILNLPTHKKIVMFGAIEPTSDLIKGFKELSVSLSFLSNEYHIAIFGTNKPSNSDLFKQNSTYLGFLHDDYSLRLAYSSADVVVVPSLQEAFGQTASESMSCGTPVVAFATSGLLDIVDHKINGYLAKPFSTKDLAQGIKWVIENNVDGNLSKASRNKVLTFFDSSVVSRKYLSLYKSLLK